MNVVFWFLIVLSLMAVWFLAYEYYIVIGKFLFNLFKNSKNAIEQENDEEENGE